MSTCFEVIIYRANNDDADKLQSVHVKNTIRSGTGPGNGHGELYARVIIARETLDTRARPRENEIGARATERTTAAAARVESLRA